RIAQEAPTPPYRGNDERYESRDGSHAKGRSRHARESRRQHPLQDRVGEHRQGIPADDVKGKGSSRGMLPICRAVREPDGDRHAPDQGEDARTQESGAKPFPPSTARENADKDDGQENDARIPRDREKGDEQRGKDPFDTSAARDGAVEQEET